jgi:hypothetical protein
MTRGGRGNGPRPCAPEQTGAGGDFLRRLFAQVTVRTGSDLIRSSSGVTYSVFW